MNGLVSLALASAAAAMPYPRRSNGVSLAPHPLKTVVPGEYIVLFKKDVSSSLSHNLVLEQAGAQIVQNYDISDNFRGFAFKSNSTSNDDIFRAQVAAKQLSAMGHIELVEENQLMFASETCDIQREATWGISRVSSEKIDTDRYIYPDSAGKGMTAYIIDSGVNVGHEEFTGRIASSELFDFYDQGGNDGNGHGTHVAGTVAGTTYGIAKAARIAPVKVLSDSGSGSNIGVIKGVEWACKEGTKRPALNKRTANMSLGGGFSKALNMAVEACVAKGMPFIVAAGNEAMDACISSPASSDAAITVMSSDITDKLSFFSNYGECTQIIAPGSDITSAWIGSTSATNTISGTSMASPHVCGVATLVLAKNPDFSPEQVLKEMIAMSEKNKIKIPSIASRSSPNDLLHSTCQ